MCALCALLCSVVLCCALLCSVVLSSWARATREGAGAREREPVCACVRVCARVCARVCVCGCASLDPELACTRRCVPQGALRVPQGCAHWRAGILLPPEVEPLPARVLARTQHEVGVRPALPIGRPLVALSRGVGAVLERVLLSALCAGAARAGLCARNHRYVYAVCVQVCLRIGHTCARALATQASTSATTRRMPQTWLPLAEGLYPALRSDTEVAAVSPSRRALLPTHGEAAAT